MDSIGYLKSILLGLVQGLTSLMPLSDDAHMLLLERLSGIGLSSAEFVPFMMALRLGVILAIICACIKPLISMLAHPIKGELKWVILSALPLLAPVLLMRGSSWEIALSGSAFMLMPYALIFTAVVLFLAQGIGKNRAVAKSAHPGMKFTDALAVGLMQCLSLFTGVSLSGMEISACLSVGLRENRCAELAYISMIPALLVLNLPDCVSAISSGAMSGALQAHGYEMLMGLLAAFVSGVLAIKLTSWLIRRQRLRFFSLYLIIASAGIIALVISGRL